MFIGTAKAVFTNAIDNIVNHVYWQTGAVFSNVIGNIMNQVYWQTRAVFTNVNDNIMNHVCLANKSGIYQCH